MVTDTAAQHVIVVGCARVGSVVARRVTAAGHTASLIDRPQGAFDRFVADWPGDTRPAIADFEAKEAN